MRIEDVCVPLKRNCIIWRKVTLGSSLAFHQTQKKTFKYDSERTLERIACFTHLIWILNEIAIERWQANPTQVHWETRNDVTHSWGLHLCRLSIFNAGNPNNTLGVQSIVGRYWSIFIEFTLTQDSFHPNHFNESVTCLCVCVCAYANLIPIRSLHLPTERKRRDESSTLIYWFRFAFTFRPFIYKISR